MNVFKRKFVAELRRCEEMERQLRTSSSLLVSLTIEAKASQVSPRTLFGDSSLFSNPCLYSFVLTKTVFQLGLEKGRVQKKLGTI